MSNFPELADFISVVDDALPHHLCDSLVRRFEEFPHLASDRESIEGFRRFHSINLQSHEEFAEAVNPLVSALLLSVTKYCTERSIPEEQLPLSRAAFEAFRLKKYPKGEGKFGTHVDVMDAGTARRALGCFWYLNDVKDGGETIFYDQGGNVLRVVIPRKGRLVIFPPTWMFPHAGMVPISDDKYFLGSYIHYT